LPWPPEVQISSNVPGSASTNRPSAALRPASGNPSCLPSGSGLQILSVSPTFVLQQTRNSLAVRRLVTHGVEKTELVWTIFGFTDDDEAMTERRLQQANLIGPAGYISMEDGAAPGFVQRGVNTAADILSVVEMGGRGIKSDDTRVTEASVRGFWTFYRAQMGL